MSLTKDYLDFFDLQSKKKDVRFTGFDATGANVPRGMWGLQEDEGVGRGFLQDWTHTG